MLVVGVNHRSAPLPVRERVAVRGPQLAEALLALRLRFSPEAAVLSTCNRTELYLAGETAGEAAGDAAAAWLAASRGLRPGELQPHLYRLHGEEAARHVFRVACGVDSMLFGDAHIRGQMKEAMRAAQAAGTLGALLHRLFQQAFAAAKEVRSTVRFAGGGSSKAAVAVRLAERIFPDLRGRAVLVTGTGPMLEAFAAHFAAQAARITVAARTVERALPLASRYGTPAALKSLSELLPLHDIVVSCGPGPLPALGRGLVEHALRARRRRPILVLDLAVPRSTEPGLERLEDVFVYTVDDLWRLVEETSDERRAQRAQAEAIIEDHARQFMRWMQAREAVPLIQALHQHAEEARRQELERGLRRLARGEEPAGVLEAVSAALASKLLHLPTRALAEASGNPRIPLAETLSRLYEAR